MNPQHGNEVTRRRFIGVAAGAAGVTTTFLASGSQERVKVKMLITCFAFVVAAIATTLAAVASAETTFANPSLPTESTP